MKVIGIVGGIASGKSAVSAFFEDAGATVLDADRMAHDVLRRPSVVEQVVERWGADVIDEQGRPRRGEIAKRVFGANGDAELSWLESVIHPLVHTELKVELNRKRATDELVVLDVPLLLERGWDADCDTVIFVDAPLDVRRQRAALRGWAPGELERREARQWPLDQKRASCDLVVENAGELDNLHQALKALELRRT